MKTPQTWGLVWNDDFDHWTIAPDANGGFVRLADLKAMQNRIELLERQVDTAHRQIERLRMAGDDILDSCFFEDAAHERMARRGWDAAKEGGRK